MSQAISTYRARIDPDGTSFEVSANESVLDAALRQGVALNYGCRHGNCSSCKYFLQEGDVDHGGASIYSLSEAQREEGYALLCCARPASDLVIEGQGGSDARAAPMLLPRDVVAEVESIAQLTSALWRLVLTLSEPLPFYPGQFVELTPPWAALRRSYSIASSPSRPFALEFIIKRVPEGAFSSQLPVLAIGERFAVRGPFGTSYLRAGAEPVLLCATGSGLSPILSILAAAAERNDQRPFIFHYGARTNEDLPCQHELAELQELMGSRLSYVPSLTRGSADWNGQRGRVTHALQRALGDARPFDAYLCGAPAMCDAVGTLLEAKGIRADHLFYDKFHPAV
ncbi:MAG: 2Fe-2S iron-sulfur cluster binding domain-containing protein [Gammaproteobacteria bacterium]|nr:2Fe-2S iron-sulfur cluster binding domain-containing protein [Gammaproteobacteria bacterium]